MPKLVAAHQAKFRYKLAAGSAVLAAIVTFIAFRFQTEPYVKSEPVKRSETERHQEVWFTAQDDLAGATREGERLRIRRWNPDQSWDITLTGAEAGRDWHLWAVSNNLERVAWIAGAALHIRELEGTTISIPIAPRRALAMTAMTDGALAAVFEDATVMRWNGETGALLEEKKLPVSAVDRAAASGDYIAIASISDRKAVLFGYRDGWAAVETSYPPEADYEVLIPAPGLLATRAGGSLRIGGELRNTPGAVRSVLSFRGNTVVTGDFENVLALKPGADPYSLAGAPAGSIAAAGRDYLAVSGGAGTSLYRLSVDERLTLGGRGLTVLATSLFCLAGAMIALPFLIQRLLDFLHFVLKGKLIRGGGKLAPEKLAGPPPELIDACAAGEAVLWAGAGLSAQAGLPDRRSFIATLLRAAPLEEWLESNRAHALLRQLDRQDPEEVMEEFARLDPKLYSQLIAYLQALVPRYVALSRSHEHLEQIPFQALVTTNYDALLDRFPGSFAENAVTLRHAALHEAMAGPFLLKLYGHLPEAETVLLARPHLAAAAGRAGFDAHLARLMATRTLLFVGCSLDALAKDLRILNAPEETARPHFAVAGAGRDWETHSAELRDRYGIRTVLCREETIAAELPLFLETLARETGVRFDARQHQPHAAV